MQTFVFSATLSKELQQNLKKRRRPKRFQKNDAPASTLDDLLLRLDFRDPDPEIIDISPKGGVVATLKESRIECLANDKVRVRVLHLSCLRMYIFIIFFCDTLGALLCSCHL
jgi:ATP-dependent RNA helicase DDX24/MAK5